MCARFDVRSAENEATQRDGWSPACERFVEAYPASRRALDVMIMRFQDAALRKDLTTMRAWAERMSQQFAVHSETQRAKARVRLDEMVGQPFSFGCAELSARAGSPHLLLIGNMRSYTTRQRLAELEGFARGRQACVVTLIELGSSAGNARETEWPSNWRRIMPDEACIAELADGWGIVAGPMIFVIEADGRLAGWSEDGDWERLARTACAD
jgi:hypothetical protein